MSAALEGEHDAIESTIWTINKATLAGAAGTVIVQLMDMVIEFCSTHFANEENFLHERGADQVDVHAEAHAVLLDYLRSVRTAISVGDPEGTLNAIDLLNRLKDHIDCFDKPAYRKLLDRPDDAEAGSGIALRQSIELARLRRR